MFSLSLVVSVLLAPPIESGDRLADFRLTSSAGDVVSLHAAPDGTKATVIAVTTLECPIAKLLLPRLAELEQRFGAKGVRFLGLDPDPVDSPAALAARAAEVGARFPILLDPFHAVTTVLGVERTTEVFVLDHDLRLVYRGAVDDQYEEGARLPEPRWNYLADALDALVAGRDVEVGATEPKGCALGPAKDVSGDLALTFHKDVAPILNAHCVECHRPDQIGPMSLQDPARARSDSAMIAEVVNEGRMPPWYADPRFGHFANERRLTETEKAVLTSWANNGAPLGDPKDAPAAPTFADGAWSIGAPDLVVELPRPIKVQGTGVLPYQYEVIDPGITEDRWVSAIEIRPTARAQTHHVLALEVPPGMTVEQAAQQMDRQGFVESGYFAVFVPGSRPNVYPPGMAKLLRAGTKFLMQLHYTPNGKKAVDRTQVAMRFAKEPITTEVKTMGVVNYLIDLPPRTADIRFTGERRFAHPVRLLTFFPHMHSRGAAFRFERVDVGGASTVLLDVPKYDFNWQDLYQPKEPVLIGAGERVRITAVYDNSEGNPNNPNPDQRVTWGDQTYEEMMIGYLDYVEAAD